VCIEPGMSLGDEFGGDLEQSAGDTSVVITSGYDPLLPQPKKK